MYVLVNPYQTKTAMGFLDTPEVRQTTLTLANATHQTSATTRVSVSCTRKKSCSNRRCQCFKNDLKCSIYCHTKVSTSHDCDNLSVLAERAQIGLLGDIPIDLELLDGIVRSPSGGWQGRYSQRWNQS